MAEKVKLDFAIGEYPHTAALLSGEVPIEGVEPNFISVKPQIGAYRRMVRGVEFDVCDIAPTTYIIARAYDAPFVALPIFVMRRFHHSGMLVRPDSGIKVPKDLEGKRVGARAYSVTTCVWTRAIFIDEYSLDTDKVTWVVDDEEHVTQMKLPANVIHATKPLADLMAEGYLQAGFAANAGVGRSGNPTGGWKEVEANYPDLFPNPEPIEAAWYKKTGIYPMHGTIVVKDDVLKKHPFVAQSLFDAFSKSKEIWLKKLNSGEAQTALDKGYRKLQQIVGPDPLPYGMAVNLPTIKFLEETAFKQKLTPKRMSIEELFVDPEKG